MELMTQGLFAEFMHETGHLHVAEDRNESNLERQPCFLELCVPWKVWAECLQAERCVELASAVPAGEKWGGSCQSWSLKQWPEHEIKQS